MSEMAPILSLPIVTGPTPDGPIVKLANSHLRQSINSILAGIDPGHGNAQFTITDEGSGVEAGVAIATRLKVPGPVQWGVVVAANYNLQERRPSLQAALNASW